MEITKIMRQLAQTQMAKIQYRKKNTALETLRQIRWPQPPREVEQKEFAKWNLSLDARGCLGRLAVSAAIIEKEFPAAVLGFGEVMEDFLASLLLETLTQKPEMIRQESFLKELLMYEEPHAVLMVNGIQFDPLSSVFGNEIIHPKVERFPIWEAVAASVINSVAWLTEDPQKKLSVLKTAQNLCRTLILTVENMAEPLELIGQKEAAVAKVRWAVEVRPTARNILALHRLTGEKFWLDKLLAKYPAEIINIVDNSN